jgi:hypothetical protein
MTVGLFGSIDLSLLTFEVRQVLRCPVPSFSEACRMLYITHLFSEESIYEVDLARILSSFASFEWLAKITFGVPYDVSPMILSAPFSAVSWVAFGIH